MKGQNYKSRYSSGYSATLKKFGSAGKEQAGQILMKA